MRPVLIVLCATLVCTGPVAGAIPTDTTPQPAHRGDGPITAQVYPQTQPDGTLFKQIDTENAGMVIELNMALLTSLFEPGSTLRLVVGGTANGERVVWFDIGIGYRGGPVLQNPMDGFIVRSEMSMALPV